MDPSAPSPWTPETRVKEHKALERQREEQARASGGPEESRGLAARSPR